MPSNLSTASIRIALVREPTSPAPANTEAFLNNFPFQVLDFDGVTALEGSSGEFAAILLMLAKLPSNPAELFRRAHAAAHERPLLVIAGAECLSLSEFAIAWGFQEFLIYEQLNTETLLRSIRHSIQRHKLVAQLKVARDAAMAASSAKTKFLTGASHELRTPLTAILGFSDLLRTQIARTSNPDYLDRIISNGKNLLALVEGILGYANLSQDEKVEQKPCSVREILEGLLIETRSEAEAKGISVTLSCPASVPAVIESDPSSIRLIVMQLIHNAIKFSEAGSVNVEISSEPRKDLDTMSVYVQVEDTGVGMDPKTAARAFEPFFRGQYAIDHKLVGTGLGLAVARELAQKLGGNLEIIQTTPRVGSCFKLSFIARIPVANSTSIPSTSLTTTIAGTRVLLVEDDIDLQILFRSILLRLKLEVEICGDGDAAVQRAKSGNFALILMDLSLPRLSGFDAMCSIRQQNYSGAIIALTAHALPQIREQCLESGFDDFLEKPIDAVKLELAIRQHVKERRA